MSELENKKEQIISIIEEKYATKYRPELQKIVNSNYEKILKYFENNYDVKINAADIHNYLKEAKEDIETEISIFLRNRKNYMIQIVTEEYNAEKEQKSINEEICKMDTTVEDERRYKKVLEIVIDEKIEETNKKMILNLDRKGYSSPTIIANFLLVLEGKSEKIKKSIINDIEGTLQLLDKELIAEICNDSVKETEKLEKPDKKTAFLNKLKPDNLDEIKKRQEDILRGIRESRENVFDKYKSKVK